MLPGEVVAGRFEIERNAGTGGMGIVYRALDRSTGDVVALKVLRQQGDVPADRFARETELLAALDHPHIVGYITHGITEERLPYLVMPWLEGEDLHQRLRGGPLTIDDTLTIATKIASALECLHAQGLVHRDLKPSNLFLPGGAVAAVQLIDLGIARQIIAPPMTISGQLVGTPGYMAPEEARGDHVVAPAIDVFALGCVLHECLTGKPLFSGSNVMAVLAKIILEEAPRVREMRPDVPEALDAIVHRMVAKDPARRPHDGAELGRWLANIWKAPAPSVRAPTLHPALTDSEQRVMTVLMATVGPRAKTIDTVDATRSAPHFGEISSASIPFGVRVHALADGTAVALAPDGMSAADQASVLARFGRHLAEAVPSANVAIATGMAVTGGRVPVGEAIERGARIVRESAAAGGLHLDDVSAALLESRFDLRRVGAGFVVERERTPLDASRPLLGRPTACIGRERELATLAAAYSAVVDDAVPGVVLVTAPPGTGKSRLRHELVRRIRGGETPPMILIASGDPLLTSTPYAVVAQLVRQAAGLREREPVAESHRKLREHVAQWMAEPDAADTLDYLAELVGAPFGDDARPELRAARESTVAMHERMRSAFEAIVLAWCGKGPVAIGLEDLHWADTESVKLVDRVLRVLRGSPLFVLALARPEVHERFPRLWAHRSVTEIHLAPLGERACTKIVRDAMGSSVTSERIKEIVARSEGNAFFLEELIRTAAESDRARTGDTRDAPLPQTVLAVVQARLERLDMDARRFLRAASVFGATFCVEGVCALVGQRDEDVQPIVHALVQHEMIAQEDEPRIAGLQEMRFRHALVRSAAYASLTAEDLSLGHRLAARWLEETKQDLEIVAQHFLEAGDVADAAQCSTRAGAAHMARARTDLGATCFLRALLLSSPTDARDDVLCRMRYAAEALDVTRGVDVARVLVGLDRHVGAEMRTGNDASALVRHAFTRALRGVSSGDASIALAEALACTGWALGALGDFRAAAGFLSEATALANVHPPTLRDVRIAAAHVARWEGAYGRVVELLSPEVVPLEGRARAETLLTLAVAEVAVRGADAFARAADRIRDAAMLLGAPAWTPPDELRCSRARLLCLSFANEHKQAIDVALAGGELAQKAGFVFERMINLQILGEMYIRLGDFARARAALAASSALAADPDDPVDRGHAQPLVSYLDGLEGDAGAASRIELVADRFKQSAYPLAELHARYWLGKLLAATHDPRARDQLALALALARRLKIRLYDDDCTTALAAL
jgi:hypothetical protein